MTIANDITTACERIRAGRDLLITSADRGGFAHPDSLEAILIRRAVADIIATVDRLEANTPADLIRKDAA
jgi:hypothetical protein